MTKLELQWGQPDPAMDDLKIVKGRLVNIKGPISTTLIVYGFTVKSNSNSLRRKIMVTDKNIQDGECGYNACKLTNVG